LLIVHSTGTSTSGRVDGKNKKTDLLPNRSHHLPSYNRITPIGANAEVKINGEDLFGNCSLDFYGLIVEINRDGLAVEKYMNVVGSRRFVQ